MVRVTVDSEHKVIVYMRDGNKVTYHSGTEISPSDICVIAVRSDGIIDYIPNDNIGYIRIIKLEKEVSPWAWIITIQ